MSFIGTQLSIPHFRVLSGIRNIVQWAKGNHLFGCICNQATVIWTSLHLSLWGLLFHPAEVQTDQGTLWYRIRGSWGWKRSLRSWSPTTNEASPCSPLNPKLFCYRDAGMSLCVSGTWGNPDPLVSTVTSPSSFPRLFLKEHSRGSSESQQLLNSPRLSEMS